MTLNGNRGPLRDTRVRQAVQRAVDTKILAGIASKGMPFQAPRLGNHFFMPNQKGYVNNAGKYGTGDTAGAKRLLQKAGWRGSSGGTRHKDGKKLRLTFVVGADSSQQSLDQAEVVQNMVKKVGIAMRIKKVPGNDYFDKYVNRGNFDLASFRNVDLIYRALAYPVFEKPRGKHVFQNYGRVSTDAIDALLRKAGGTNDSAKSRSLYNKADRLIWDAGHSLEWYQRPEVLAVRKNIANFGASGLGSVDWLKVGFLKKDAKSTKETGSEEGR